MASEILQTPAAVAALLDGQAGVLASLGAHLRGRDPPVVVTVARGSSDHAAGFFKYLCEILLGVPVASVGPSVASLYAAPLRLRGAVAVAVSQSGRSPDIVALQAAARSAGALTVAVVNDGASPLAGGADVVLPLGAGVERSVAATKTCVASAAALAALVAEWGDDARLRAAVRALPSALDATLRRGWADALPCFAAAPSAYVVGRGPALPVASEAALKLKETAMLHAEAFSGAEVMHGPLQLLGPGFPVMAFAQADASRPAMRDTVARLAVAGGRVFTVAADGGDLPATPCGHPLLDPLPMLLGFYAFAEALARARGHDPDRPSHLRKVTETL